VTLVFLEMYQIIRLVLCFKSDQKSKNKNMEELKFKRKLFLMGIIALAMLPLFLCGKSPESKLEEIILAKVGNKTISLHEFIGRAEYTIRPKYCNGNHIIHKKIVLNSILAEKMFALEAGDTNTLVKNEHFQRYIEGRKQQAMRQWLYHKQGVEKVTLDEAVIKKIYKLAGRRYRVNYFSINNDSLAEIIGNEIKENAESFGSIYFELSGLDTIPEREVDYNIRESEVIHNALFAEPLNVGDVIGPLKTEDGSHVFIKINGWIDSHVLNENDVSQRYRDVKEDLTRKKAKEIYEKYVAQIMKGKSIDFYPDTFNKLAKIVGTHYFAEREQEKERFLNKSFDRELKNQQPEIGIEIEDIKDQPLFRVDGKTWTVKDFRVEVEIHPLVYRNKKMARSDFANQFRLSIVDMIRDKYLAENAYEKGYDKVDLVKRNTEMWRDASIALFHKSQYLKKVSSEEEDPIVLIQKYLNPYVDKLQQKFSDVIEVNIEEFDKLNLTRTDMFVTQSNVPFPVMVPSFPQLTTDHKLDYGKRMEID
jgi:hypothetical protein